MCGPVVKLERFQPSADESPKVSQFGSCRRIGVRIAFTFWTSASFTERVFVSARSVARLPSMKVSDALATERASASRPAAMLSRPACVWLCTSASSIKRSGTKASAMIATIRRRSRSTVGDTVRIVEI